MSSSPELDGPEFRPQPAENAEGQLASAVERLREIAALKGTSKRQRVNSELAISWLLAHGYALWPGGYIPGVGFEDSDAAASRRQTG